jgi:hypothetical protein
MDHVDLMLQKAGGRLKGSIITIMENLKCKLEPDGAKFIARATKIQCLWESTTSLDCCWGHFVDTLTLAVSDTAYEHYSKWYIKETTKETIKRPKLGPSSSSPAPKLPASIQKLKASKMPKNKKSNKKKVVRV